MSLSILLSIIGIAASVLVGVGTFFVADKRSRRHKYLTAKNLIMQDLSKSLSENNVPSYEIVQSTIKSVLRELGHSNFSVISVEEIVDDLIRQITSDPFLDSERRAKLQQDVMKVTILPVSERLDRDLGTSQTVQELETKEYVTDYKEDYWLRVRNVLIAFVTTIAAGFSVLSLPVEKVVEYVATNSGKLSVIFAIVAGLITVVITVSSILLRKKS